MNAVPYRSEKVAHQLRAIDAAILREIRIEGQPAGGSEEHPIFDVAAMFNPDERKRVAKWAGSYVPGDFLCHGDNGFGDYIIFKVGFDGLIEKYRAPEVKMNCGCDDDDQSGWAVVA